jgi:glutamate N-acetyltransferase/amino-acid N-acetyltransferase
MQYPDSTDYRLRLSRDSILPDGFQTAVTSLEFVPVEKPDAGGQAMNLALIRLAEPTEAFGGVFTRNAFPGWPVVQGRELLGSTMIQGVLVNNKVANVGVDGGLEASRRLSDSSSLLFGDSAPYIPSSTGVIGWSLPVSAMEKALPDLPGKLQSESLLPFAEAIMTTDSWPKVRSSSCGGGRIVGTAKGAGMVEPNMATMLAFFLTDIDVPRETLRSILSEVIDESFNRISVDGETSTSDTVLLFSSRRYPYPGDEEFRRSLSEAALNLAEDVVRNGEGTAHVFRVTVSGVRDVETAVSLARSVANAPLTKTAVRGNDPNVGRVLQALGAACGRIGLEIPMERITLDIGGTRVFRDGTFHLDDDGERTLSRYFKEKELPVPAPDWPLHEERVEIDLNLCSGDASASVTGSDLSEEYVKINADYRT